MIVLLLVLYVKTCSNCGCFLLGLCNAKKLCLCAVRSLGLILTKAYFYAIIMMMTKNSLNCKCLYDRAFSCEYVMSAENVVSRRCLSFNAIYVRIYNLA